MQNKNIFYNIRKKKMEKRLGMDTLRTCCRSSFTFGLWFSISKLSLLLLLSDSYAHNRVCYPSISLFFFRALVFSSYLTRVYNFSRKEIL